jgi:hypothetical protein
MGKPTNEYMLLNWLKERVNTGNTTIASHEIQLEFPRYVRIYWEEMILPDTASRLWRKVRETQSYQNIGIEEVVEQKTESKQAHWALVRS